MFYLKSLPVLPATLLALAFSTTASHAGLRDDLPTSEYNALVAIYESTGGDGWENNTGWLDPSADSWFGITTRTTGTGRTVSEIDLHRNELSGSIPPEFANLSNLEDFNIGVNFIEGEIPAAFATFPNLVVLAIEDNLFDLSSAANSSLVLSLEARGVSVRTAPGSSYPTWIAHHFTPEELESPNISGQLDDPDHDGVVNLIEYAQRTDPTSPTAPPLPAPTVFIEDSVLIGASTDTRVGTALRDILYLAEISTDLQTWTPSEIFDRAVDSTEAILDITLFVESSEPHFFRVRVEYVARDQPFPGF